MRLDENPLNFIPRPTFSGKAENQDIANQWKRWRDLTKSARDVFDRLKLKKHNLGATSRDYEAWDKELRRSQDYVQKVVRDAFSLTKAVEGIAILEGVRRFLELEDCGDLAYVSEEGYMPWELDIK